jgi:Mn2+/Fe2+ NRAMP family transporter
MGLTGTLKKNYPKIILQIMLVFSFPAIILNIGANIAGMGAVANLLFPSISSNIFSVAFTIILLVAIIYFPYRKIASILKYLCAALLVYIIVPFLSKQNWSEVIHSTFIPRIEFNKNFIIMLVAILGTTISPYLFFWQASMEVEEQKQKKKKLIVNNKIISEMKKDIDLGMLFSNLIMFFIIFTTGTVLFNNNIHQIDTVEQAAMALKPLAGNASYYLFAIGIIGTGLLSIPVLSGSLSYMFSETFSWEQGLDKKFHQARPFYMVIAVSLVFGLIINYIGISPLKALLYAAILYGITAPVLIAIILHICNNKKIMGQFTNSRTSNILGVITLVFMTLAAFLLLYFQFLA